MAPYGVLRPEVSGERYVLHVAGENAAEIEAPRARTVSVTPTVGDPYGVETRDRGWHLIAVRYDGEVLLWYEPRRLRTGGTIILPGGEEYSVRSRLMARLDDYVRDDAGRLVLATFARPLPEAPRPDATVEVRRLHGSEEEAPCHLLVTFCCVLSLLSFRQAVLTVASR